MLDSRKSAPGSLGSEPVRNAAPVAPLRGGLMFGLLAVLGWAVFNVSSKAAVTHGFRPSDLTLLRFVVSGAACLPLLWRAGWTDAGGLGWGRTFLLALVSGPLFGQLVNAAMPLAPLSHTTVMVPSVAMLVGLALGRLLLKERVSKLQWLGVALMGCGLLWLMLLGGGRGATPNAWIGDALLVLAGLLWTAYTLLLKRWNANPVAAVAAVNVLSGLVYLPIYLAAGHRLPHVGLGWLSATAVIQGVVAALATVYCYAQSVRLLGATRAAVLPAIVPPVALILGALALHDIPSWPQLAAVTVAMIGFTCAVGAWSGAVRLRTLRA